MSVAMLTQDSNRVVPDDEARTVSLATSAPTLDDLEERPYSLAESGFGEHSQEM
jgi:hypothetical protein